jgi:soluble P-type ATPase
MTLSVDIPGSVELKLETVVLDINGTLTDRGALLPGVAQRLLALKERLRVILASADTFGTLDDLADKLGIETVRMLRPGEAQARSPAR